MALDYSIDAVLQSVLARCYENTSGLSSADLLRLANEEVGNYLLPYIQSARQDYFVTHADTALVSGTSRYDVPTGATAAELRAICLVDANGNIVQSLPQIELEELIRTAQQITLSGTGLPAAYYFEGNQVVMFPNIGTSPGGYSVRMFYYNRPSELVYGKTSSAFGTTNAALSITALSQGSGVFTVGYSGATPSGVLPSTFFTGAAVDLVKNRPGFDVTASTTVSGAPGATSMILVGTIPTNLVVGDWLCPGGQAPVIVGVPGEIITGPFAHWLVVKLMEARADDDAFDRALKTLQASEQRCLQYLRTRNTGNIRQLSASPFKFKGYGGLRRFY